MNKDIWSVHYKGSQGKSMITLETSPMSKSKALGKAKSLAKIDPKCRVVVDRTKGKGMLSRAGEILYEYDNGKVWERDK